MYKFPHTNPSFAQEIQEIPLSIHNTSIQSCSLWPIYNSHGVYSSGPEGDTHSSVQRYKNPIVTNDSVCLIKTNLPQIESRVSRVVPRKVLGGEFENPELTSTQIFEVAGYQYDF